MDEATEVDFYRAGQCRNNDRALSHICLVFAPPLAVGVMVLIGMSLEGVAQHSVQRDQCLKAATNGYEIRQCR